MAEPRLPAEDRLVVEAVTGTFTERMRAIVPYMFQRVWNTGDLELVESFWSPGIVLHSPVKDEPVVGRDAVVEYARIIHGAFDGLHFDVEAVLADGDQVVLRVVQSGVHTGDYFGIPPTHRPVRMEEVFTFRVSEGGPTGGWIEEVWLSLNALDLMRQLRLFPKGDPPRPVLRAVIRAQRRLDRSPRTSASAAPGPRGVGYVPRLGRDPAGLMLDLRDSYGDVVHVRRGPMRGMYVFHPEGVARILQGNSANYAHGTWFASKVAATLAGGIPALDGDAWHRHRAALQPIFGGGAREQVTRIALDEARRTAERWDSRVGAGTVDIRHEMETYDLGVAGRAIFGPDFHAAAALLREARLIFVEEAGRELTSPLGLLPLRTPTPFNRRFLRIRADLDAMLYAAIRRRRREGGDDLLAALAAARDPGTGSLLGDREVRDHAAAVFVFWQPTAILLTTLWIQLAHNPLVARRLRDEVAGAAGSSPPSPGQLGELRYMDMVIDEAIRVQSPIFLQPREALAEDEIGGYRIPAGMRVALCPYVTNRHPDVWEAPHEFRPERFRDAGERAPHVLFRFGEPGPRHCLGLHFSLAEIKAALAVLAPRFAPRLASAEPPPTRFNVAVDYPRGVPAQIVRAPAGSGGLDVSAVRESALPDMTVARGG